LNRWVDNWLATRNANARNLLTSDPYPKTPTSKPNKERSTGDYPVRCHLAPGMEIKESAEVGIDPVTPSTRWFGTLSER
jgi:hypothetical protein